MPAAAAATAHMPGQRAVRNAASFARQGRAWVFAVDEHGVGWLPSKRDASPASRPRVRHAPESASRSREACTAIPLLAYEPTTCCHSRRRAGQGSHPFPLILASATPL